MLEVSSLRRNLDVTEFLLTTWARRSSIRFGDVVFTIGQILVYEYHISQAERTRSSIRRHSKNVAETPTRPTLDIASEVMLIQREKRIASMVY